MKKTEMKRSLPLWIGISSEKAGQWHWTIWNIPTGKIEGTKEWIEDALCDTDEPFLEDSWEEEWEGGKGVCFMIGEWCAKKVGAVSSRIETSLKEMGMEGKKTHGIHSAKKEKLMKIVEKL